MKLSTKQPSSASFEQQNLSKLSSSFNVKRVHNLSDEICSRIIRRQLPTLLKLEIRQAGDRMNAIRAGFIDKNPYKSNQNSNIVQTLTAIQNPSQYISGTDKKSIGSGKVFSLEQLSLQKIETPNANVSSIDESRMAKPVLQQLPINLPSTSVEHTVNVEAYLANRLPSGLMDVIRKSGAEFFLFNASDQDIATHYKGKGFDTCYKISSPTSTPFYLLTNHHTKDNKVVVSGIGSYTRLEHQLLQFHFAGIDVGPKITSIGNIDELKSTSLMELKDQLNNIQADEKILYIGARWKVMEAIANQIFHLSGENEGQGYRELNPHHHKIGPFIFDSAILSRNNKTIAVAALRMPNGELSYDAVKAFADCGFSKIVMCGAGGRIAGDAQLGDYLHLNRSYYKDSIIDLSTHQILMPNRFSHINTTACSNITVNSPLIETQPWLSQQQANQVGSVDVETAHIFRAINDSPHPLKVISGMFISDIVGQHPLEDKISGNGADKYIDDFVKVTWETLLQIEGLQ